MPVAAALYVVIAALIVAGAPAASVSLLVAGLALVVALAVVTGVREVWSAVDALPAFEERWDAAPRAWLRRNFTATASGGPGAPTRRVRTFDALIEVPAFRWYMFSQIGNQSAQLMQMVTRGFLAYHLTGSFAALGAVELAASIPRLFLAMYGGVVADRSSRRIIVQVGQVCNAILAVILAGFYFAGQLRFEHLVIGALLQGVMNSFVMPARQSMIPGIVGRDRLMNAYALNQFGMNMLRLGAPALAGAMIAAVGAGWVYALMAFLFLFGLVALFRVPKMDAMSREAPAASDGLAPLAEDTLRRRGPDRGGLRAMREAFVYMRGQPVLQILLFIHVVVGILALPYQRLLPGFVDTVLSGGDPAATARLMGALLSFTAVGALTGSLLIASLPSRGRGKLLIASLAIFSVGLLAFAASGAFWISAFIVMVLGLGQAGRQSLVQILIQSNVSDEYRGRVSSILVLEDGIESIGIFMIALVAQAFGPQLALAGVAVTLAFVAGAMWLTPTIRELP
ncbi:MAG: MFS transporter [Dehalococcoidia bacterium]|nr:MFS transporter [Dehalococcoidia bacterium]